MENTLQRMVILSVMDMVETRTVFNIVLVALMVQGIQARGEA